MIYILDTVCIYIYIVIYIVKGNEMKQHVSACSVKTMYAVTAKLCGSSAPMEEKESCSRC